MTEARQTLVERLRAGAGGGKHWMDLHTEAADEIERLTAALAHANDQAEHFERWWYLRGDALEQIRSWAAAYPLDVFPEPDMRRAHEVLEANGLSLGAISAHAMRHVITQVSAIVCDGLAGEGQP